MMVMDGDGVLIIHERVETLFGIRKDDCWYFVSVRPMCADLCVGSSVMMMKFF
jgi:hypothetical protein